MFLEEPFTFTLMDKTPLVVTGKVLSELEISGETKQVELFVADIPCKLLEAEGYSRVEVLTDANEFILEQRKDHLLSQIIKQVLLNENNSVLEEFLIENDLLMYVDGTQKHKVAVPKQLVSLIIVLYHCIPTCHFLGTRKTTSKIKEQFYWKNMKREVEGFEKRCRICQLYKPLHQKLAGYSSSLPWEVVAMDLLGPCSENREGTLDVIVITEHFARFCFLFTLKRDTDCVERIQRYLGERER
ncbi:hypothetical protein HOLleu_05126 [Holothuria leucospilota]|uniref:Integrase zinc-binding domain-containing protein n=1 Tax=Holothuria leucospilota TaxID=206669 RepID=A0A9Q1HH75_HOLLE|nr:hypothetical protein HOLleu_05126 [Holothuria leucospilota]